MMQELEIKGITKQEKYEALIPQIKALVAGEKDLIANLGNIAAALHFGMRFFWTGFYKVDGNELVLSVFQGPIACTRIKKGKGVCGTAWENSVTQIVDNVDEFVGHIACSSETKSEIVIPIFNAQKQIIYVLDIDSTQLATFDKVDQKYLEDLTQFISTICD